MTTVQPTVQWLESSLQSHPEFRMPFESSWSKTSLPSSSPSGPPWPWPPCWPRGYWGRPGPGPEPHIYFIVWTFQIGMAAAGTEKGKVRLFKTSVVCWAEQEVEALYKVFPNFICFISMSDHKSRQNYIELYSDHAKKNVTFRISATNNGNWKKIHKIKKPTITYVCYSAT